MVPHHRPPKQLHKGLPTASLRKHVQNGPTLLHSMSSISMFASAAALALVPGLALEKGMNQVSILTVDGTRNGLVYVPESYEPNGEPLPFVLNW